MKQVANFVGFQIGWWTSVLGAAGHRLRLGPITVGSCSSDTSGRLNEARQVLLVGILGACINSALRLWGAGIS